MIKHRNHDEIAGIQYVRAIAVCLVVVTHASGILGLSNLFGVTVFDGMLYKAAVGVDLFFVVSGFIITIVSLNKGTLAPRLNVFDYAAKRFTRIIPFLWICVIVYALFRFIGTGSFEAGPYLTALFLWPIGEPKPPVVWTLRHEAIFYLVFALSFLGKKRRAYLLLLWCMSPLIYNLFPGSAGVVEGTLHELTRFFFNPSNLTFGCGVLLGLAYQKTRNFHSPSSLSPVVSGLLMLAGCVALFFSFNGFGSARVNLFASLVVFISLWIPTSFGKLAQLAHVLGDASYSIYLTHNLIILIGATAWIALFGPRYYSVALLLLPLVAVLCGVLIHFWVERPIVRVGQDIVMLANRKIKRPVTKTSMHATNHGE